LQAVLLLGPGIILKTKDNKAKIMATLMFGGFEPGDPDYKFVTVASLGFN
jgi:hypothetical protein